MEYHRLPYEDFVAIYQKVPRAVVDIVLQTPGGIVMTKRSMPPHVGKWHICGGTVLFMEPIEHAVDRIVKEELGVRVKVIRHLGIIEYFDDGGRHTISNCFLAKIASGKLRGSEQGKEFFIFDKLPKDCIPEQEAFLRKNHLPF